MESQIIGPIIMCSMFIIFGIVLIIYENNKNSKLKAKCTQEVLGKIIHISSIYNDGSSSSKPIYEIEYNGEIRRISPKEYSNIDRFVVGRVDKLKINPTNPEEFIYPNRRSVILTYIIGFGSVLGGIIPILFLLNIL